ncbi:RICIN domain-containing protein [Streptomyces sp. NPDC094032]|uniref:RICIN domain-containing protein n=1 Tax=Streptomyces sp. NPDC094032 TaxID=3155308 RepID=UPI003321B225
MLAAITAILSAMALNLLAAGPSQARTEDLFGVQMYNYSTHKCLDIPDTGAPNLGSTLQQHDCIPGSGDNQRWDIVDTGDGFLIRNSKRTDLCLDIADYGVPGNAKVGFYWCNGTMADNQLWYALPDSTGKWYRIVNALSYNANRPVCLDVAGYADPTNDLPVGVYTCSSSLSDDHWWQFRY